MLLNTQKIWGHDMCDTKNIIAWCDKKAWGGMRLGDRERLLWAGKIWAETQKTKSQLRVGSRVTKGERNTKA